VLRSGDFLNGTLAGVFIINNREPSFSDHRLGFRAARASEGG
jgi:hypothetical protein